MLYSKLPKSSKYFYEYEYILSKSLKGVYLSNTLWQIYVVVIGAYNRHPNKLLIKRGTYFFFL